MEGEWDWKKGLILGGVAFAALATGLYVKNVISEGQMRDLTKQQVVHIFKKVRKEKFIVYKQVAAFAQNIAQQMRNNVNAAMIEQFINGPESPINVQQEHQRILKEVCQANKTSPHEFNMAVERLTKEKDEDVTIFVQQAQKDYKNSLTGRLPEFYANVPPHLTKEKFLELQNAITKKAYVQQVEIFRKLSKHSEEQLQANPSLLKGMGNSESEQQQILNEEGLDSEYIPALAVFEKAAASFKEDAAFIGRVNYIEKAYQQVLMKYAPKMQNKSLTDYELNEFQDEIIFLDPLGRA